ncbi:MAG: hypothetical protein Q7T33_02155 [Dehalococcoidia bacterium]|nr:hypothetical protein [Dehalococcoidia bacterium]
MDLVYCLHYNAIIAPKRRQSAAIIGSGRAGGQTGHKAYKMIGHETQHDVINHELEYVRGEPVVEY